MGAGTSVQQSTTEEGNCSTSLYPSKKSLTERRETMQTEKGNSDKSLDVGDQDEENMEVYEDDFEDDDNKSSIGEADDFVTQVDDKILLIANSLKAQQNKEIKSIVRKNVAEIGTIAKGLPTNVPYLQLKAAVSKQIANIDNVYANVVMSVLCEGVLKEPRLTGFSFLGETLASRIQFVNESLKPVLIILMRGANAMVIKGISAGVQLPGGSITVDRVKPNVIPESITLPPLKSTTYRTRERYNYVHVLVRKNTAAAAGGSYTLLRSYKEIPRGSRYMITKGMVEMDGPEVSEEFLLSNVVAPGK